MRLLATLAIAAALVSTGAEAATFKPIYKGHSMVMTGEIAPGDDKRFAFAFHSSCNKYHRCPERLFLNSIGGDVQAGLLIGGLVYDFRIDAVVGKTDKCFSSCVFIFALARHRAYFETSVIGVHRIAYMDGRDDFEGSEKIGLMLVDRGMPSTIAGKMITTPNASVTFLTAADVVGWAEFIESD